MGDRSVAPCLGFGTPFGHMGLNTGDDTFPQIPLGSRETGITQGGDFDGNVRVLGRRELGFQLQHFPNDLTVRCPSRANRNTQTFTNQVKADSEANSIFCRHASAAADQPWVAAVTINSVLTSRGW